MSSRRTLASLLAAALVATCAALFFRDSTVALCALAFSVAGALAARLYLAGERSAPSSSPPDVQARAEAFIPSKNNLSPMPAKMAAREAQAVAGSGATVAHSVPATALLEATMESMREGVLVVDASTRVVASNRTAREIFGGGAGAGDVGAAGSLLSRRLTEVTRNPSIHAAFVAALERGERAEAKVETHVDAHGGERRMFDLRVAPLRTNERASGVGAIGVFFDITRLERLERVRQEFLSNVSHELRTPLAAILAFVETLEEGAASGIPEEQTRRFLSVIRRNAERMRNLVDDILELSAIEAGTVAVEPAPLRLHALVSDVLTSLSARADGRHVELRNEVAPALYVYADARRLEQMLTNLVDNAIKFNRDGGTVTITHEACERGDRVSVADTGDGIAPEHAARLFERFYRVDRARDRAQGGTGLGLAIVKHLARAHGGEATVASAPNEGSVFSVELPAAPDPKTSDAAAEPEMQA